MRSRDRLAAVLLALALGGCVSANPDPRKPTLQNMERQGMGGWIVVTTKQHRSIAGELISVEEHAVYVLSPVSGLSSVARRDVASAELYRYDSESGIGGWGALGSVSTLTHGFFLVLSLPVWLLWTGATAAVESSHVILEIPGDGWTEVSKWARFPQGLPMGFGAPGRRRAPGGRPPHAPTAGAPVREPSSTAPEAPLEAPPPPTDQTQPPPPTPADQEVLTPTPAEASPPPK